MHYLAVKKLPELLWEITSKHHSDFYCLNCFHSFATENEWEYHKKVCENNYFCNIVMPSEHTKVLEVNQYKKSDKVPFVIYADFESLIENIDGCKNLENSFSTTKVSEHIPSSFSMPAISSFKSIENKHDVYWDNESLREHAMKIINFKKKKTKLLTKEQQESYKNAKICYICKEQFGSKYVKDKKCP